MVYNISDLKDPQDGDIITLSVYGEIVTIIFVVPAYPRMNSNWFMHGQLEGTRIKKVGLCARKILSTRLEKGRVFCSAVDYNFIKSTQSGKRLNMHLIVGCGVRDKRPSLLALIQRNPKEELVQMQETPIEIIGVHQPRM